MVDPAFNFETVLSRLEYVREKTLCPSKAAFAAWLEAGSPQTVQQWERGISMSWDRFVDGATLALLALILMELKTVAIYLRHCRFALEHIGRLPPTPP